LEAGDGLAEDVDGSTCFAAFDEDAAGLGFDMAEDLERAHQGVVTRPKRPTRILCQTVEDVCIASIRLLQWRTWPSDEFGSLVRCGWSPRVGLV
jgi:hypothetical protein